ncbi:MAG TPA: aminoglycoside phosphotransferase family protein [Longimicrobiaceae bacterium]|nr:aminoglycoside phosphotransferase family protein [Longimicrobiaceae bacterium]
MPFPLDHRGAAALLASRLPGADGRPLEPLGEGDYCLAFRWGSRVVRAAKHPAAAAALRREACVLAEVAGLLPLPVPRPEYHAPPGCPPFTVHDEVRGEVLTREGWEGMPAPARTRAASDLAAFLRALHSLPAEVGDRCGLERLDAASKARSLRGSCAEGLHARLDRETRDRLDAALAGWSSPAPGAAPEAVLLHRDVAPGHLLCDPATGRLTGVIDFGDVALGEPARDFVYVYEDFGPAILAEVLAAYAGERAPALLPEVRRWYLLEAVEWTVAASGAGGPELEEGLAEIRRELAAPEAVTLHTG